MNHSEFARRIFLGCIFILMMPLAAAAAVSVQVAPVRAVVAEGTEVHALGEVRSNAAATLVAPVGGRVLEALPGDGLVQGGMVIARIEVAGFPAQIAAAQAQARYSQQALQRDQRLFDDGVIARQQVDSAQLAAGQARDALAALQQQVAAAQITAPGSGMLQYLVPNGTQVAAGAAVASFDGRGRPWIQALLPPSLVQELAVGDPVTIIGDGVQARGRIRSIGQSARQSGLVMVLIQLPAASHYLPGQWVRLRLRPHVKPVQATVEIPEQAVVMRGNQSFVWKLWHGHAQRVPVRILAREGAAVQVQGSLHAGDDVITRGATRLAPGAAVTVQP